MIRRILAIAGAVFLDAVKRRIVYLIGFFGVVMALAIPALPSYNVGVQAGVYREIALALTFVAALALTMTLSANRIPGEIERRTVYGVLSKAVGRWEYVVGTWLGIFGVIGVCVLGFAIVDVAVGGIVYSQFMPQLFAGAYAIWLEMGIVAAFAVAVSGMSGAVVVTVASLTFLFAAHSRDSLFPYGTAKIVLDLYPSLDAFNVINPVAYGSGVGPLYATVMTATFVGWVGLLLLLGSLGFARKDL
jgi:ABC-type transport system involved in multi-copper enzyme maturation permease subunit